MIGMMQSSLLVIFGILSALAPEQTGAFQVTRLPRLEPLSTHTGTRISHQASTKSNLFVKQRGIRLRSTPATVTDDDEEQRTLVRRTRKLILALFRILMAPLRLLRANTKESKATDVAEAFSSLDVEELPPIVVESAVVTAAPSVESTVIVDEPITTPAAEAIDAASKKSIRAAKRVANSKVADRWATASVDLTGDWTMIESEDFKQQYDEYLRRLGQPMIVRGIALGIIGLTTELTKQEDDGRTLFIRGTNARGVWERSLQSSDGVEPREIDVVTADDEIVKAEAWWEKKGTVHVSWMRGVSKYGGGDFMSRRYLEQGGKVLVCETVFHPNDKTRETANVTWKFGLKGQKR